VLVTLCSSPWFVYCKFMKAHSRTRVGPNPIAFPAETHTLIQTGQLLPGRGGLARIDVGHDPDVARSF
jgi:hypothetical protein